MKKRINQKKYKESLIWICRILKKNKIRFNVLGGLAARAYGAKRMLVDIDLCMSLRDMKKLSRLTKRYVVEFPWDLTSSSGLWKGYYMELNYKGIAIEIGESEKTKFYNKQMKKWESFPDGLYHSPKKKLLGLLIPVMPKKNLISYKTKLGRKVDLLDLKQLK